MTETALALSPTPDFSGMRLTQSATGHVYSPWFTIEAEHRDAATYQQVHLASGWAFARAVGRTRFAGTFMEIIFHQRPEADGPWWRWSTAQPCELPKPTVPTLKVRDPLAIDV